MTLKIDSDRLRKERLQRAWSQEQLSLIAGLGLRTVHRIEKSGQCSLESLSALAAAFELRATDLQQQDVIETVEKQQSQAAAQDTRANVANRGLSGWSKLKRAHLTGGLIGALLGVGGMMVASGVAAEQVMPGEAAVIQIDNLLRIELVPGLNPQGRLIEANIYTWQKDGFVLATEPRLLTQDHEPASIQMSLPNGQVIEMALTTKLQ
jgi:transcriptional regulator with XRE-family HTH domain